MISANLPPEVKNNFWSWFAGFWEGEGSFIISTRNCQFTISQKDPTALFYIQWKLGGQISKYQNTLTKRNPSSNHIYNWRLNGGQKRILEVIEKMSPFLISRREEVFKKAIKIQNKIKDKKKNNNYNWSKKETKFLLDNWKILPDWKIGKELRKVDGIKRSEKSVIKKRHRLGLIKNPKIIGNDFLDFSRRAGSWK